MGRSSGVWVEDYEDRGIIIGVTDFGVEAFGGSDWEWSATFDRKNADILIANLKNEFGDNVDLEEMLRSKFGDNLATSEFRQYCDSLHLVYKVKRECV